MNRQTGDEHRYDDIMGLPHHQSEKYPHMPLLDRAAQFASFAALTGHKEAVWETARLTEQKPELDENQKAVLDEKIKVVISQLNNRNNVMFTYFKPDSKKSGGAIVHAVGVVKKIDLYQKIILLENGEVLPVADILEINLCPDRDA